MITTPIDWASERIAKKLTEKIQSLVDAWVTAKLGRKPTDKEMWIHGQMKVKHGCKQVYCWKGEEFLEVEDETMNNTSPEEAIFVVRMKYLAPLSEKN